eukprot:TRINITY_DN28128_c2_g1_i4.p1 TRINITY_DN28128_c2_g1~~TRINITY_DN28128_c2_g1_i4.p1  ORF type:complete len:223 (+),score=29.71 TRINITY_DN28128_c2_g1_i4:305-973(+)
MRYIKRSRPGPWSRWEGDLVKFVAASMSSVGKPRCPSCRASLRVEFDATAGRLVFFTEPEDEPQADNPATQASAGVLEANNATRMRLAAQTKPRQKEILKQFGNELRTGESTSRPVPRCVCGGELQMLPLRQRVHRQVEPKGENGFMVYAGRRFTVDDLIRMGAITCDICDKAISEGMHVWTCENGRDTILHAHSYDICSQCFEDFAGCSASSIAEYCQSQA